MAARVSGTCRKGVAVWYPFGMDDTFFDRCFGAAFFLGLAFAAAFFFVAAGFLAAGFFAAGFFAAAFLAAGFFAAGFFAAGFFAGDFLAFLVAIRVPPIGWLYCVC